MTVEISEKEGPPSRFYSHIIFRWLKQSAWATTARTSHLLRYFRAVSEPLPKTWSQPVTFVDRLLPYQSNGRMYQSVFKWMNIRPETECMETMLQRKDAIHSWAVMLARLAGLSVVRDACRLLHEATRLNRIGDFFLEDVLFTEFTYSVTSQPLCQLIFVKCSQSSNQLF